MVEQQPVEQRLVGVLELAQVDVPFQVGGFVLVGFMSPRHLFVESLLARWQQTEQSQLPCAPLP